MRITISLDTQAVITQPSPLRVKAGSFVPVEIAFTRGAQSTSLPNGAVIEFALKMKNQWTGGLLAYLNVFASAAGNIYTGALNCGTESLLGVLGLQDSTPLNDVAQVETNGEVTWSIGNQKLRSLTFPVTIESPVIDANPAASPDPDLYPMPDQIALKSDLSDLVIASERITDSTQTGRALIACSDEILAAVDGSELIPARHDGAFRQLLTSRLASWIGETIGPNGSNRIEITDRFAIASLPTQDVNGNPITKVHIGDIVRQTGVSGGPTTAIITFSDHTVSDDDVNNGFGVTFCDENGNNVAMSFVSFGGVDTFIAAADLAIGFADVVNSSGLNVQAEVTGAMDSAQISVSGLTQGPLTGAWSFLQDVEVASYSETAGTASLPPGDFVVADKSNLGNAAGYQRLGGTVDFLSGSGSPTLNIGGEGSGYINVENGDFHHRDASGWQFVLNIMGPPGTSGAPGRDGTNAMRVGLGDPSQVGTLLWTCKPLAYAVGTTPIGACFDGANIWVANNGSNNVTKLNATTGAVVGTYAVGTAPVGICFDGTNIWVANSGSNNVSKLLASDGSVAGTYTVGTSPRYLCFDGTRIWVTNAGSNNVSRLTASTGAVIGAYPAAGNPVGICFDGTNVWVGNSNNTTRSLTKFLAGTGALVGTYDYGWEMNTVMGLCFDGSNIWAASNGSFSYMKIEASTAERLGCWTTTNEVPILSPYALCFDGTYVWATFENGYVRKINPQTGEIVARHVVGSGSKGICFDGVYVWVTNSNSNTVMKV